VVVECVDTDSGCFPFDFDESEVDVGVDREIVGVFSFRAISDLAGKKKLGGYL